MQSYRMKCRNTKCGGEFHRAFKPEEFDQLQYGGDQKGIACYNCGYPKMVIIKSNRSVKDGFQAGFQRNIRRYCSTYSEYKAALKEMGLVEIGYEDLPETEEPRTNYFDDDVMKLLYEKHGVVLSGRESDHLQGKI